MTQQSSDNIKMQGTNESLTPCDTDKMGLKNLDEVFGSFVSREDIESAYLHANRNVNAAADILSTQGNASNSAWDSTVASSQLPYKADHLGRLPPIIQSNDLQKPFSEEKRIGAPNSNRSSASMGSVSGIIGKGYAQPQKSVNQLCEPIKALKLDSDEWLVSSVQYGKDPSFTKPGNSSMGNNLQEFLIKMLVDGFQLEQEQIVEVLGHCGYDMQIGMEHLFQLSASTLKKSDDVVDISEKMSNGKHLGVEYLSSQEQQYKDSGPSDEAMVTKASLRGSQKNRNDLQKEILQSLFTVPERSEQAPKRIISRRLNLVGVVDKPFCDTLNEACSHVTVSEEQQDVKEEDIEDSFDMLRQAVKEYWVTMKEYYKAAVDAFTKGDHALADKLLSEGRSFYERARKADDKSAEKLFDSRKSQTVFVLDLRFHDTTGALRLLETHLSSLSGISSMNLKIILASSEDAKKEARKRLKILKVLEQASIGWTDDDNGQVLWIPLEKINPKTLKFPKKG